MYYYEKGVQATTCVCIILGPRYARLIVSYAYYNGNRVQAHGMCLYVMRSNLRKIKCTLRIFLQDKSDNVIGDLVSGATHSQIIVSGSSTLVRSQGYSPAISLTSTKSRDLPRGGTRLLRYRVTRGGRMDTQMTFGLNRGLHRSGCLMRAMTKVMMAMTRRLLRKPRGRVSWPG